MKGSFSRIVFGERYQIASLGQLRERLLNILLSSTVIIGVALFAIYLVPTINHGFPGITIIYTLLFIWLLVILFVRRIPYLVRTASWVGILYALGVIFAILHGLGFHAGLLFLAFVIMTTLLVGMRSGLAAFLASIITMTTLGILSVMGIINPIDELLPGSPLYWLGGGVIFLLAGTILVISTTTLIYSMEEGLIKATSLAGKLDEAYATLQANEERFRAMIEDSMDIISIVGKDGSILYVNPSPERILGYTTEELRGRKFLDFLHPEDLKLALAAMTPGIPAEEIGPSLEIRVRHKNGSYRTLEVRGNEMHSNPAVNGTIVVCRDITDRKETEKALLDSHHLQKMVFASMSGAIFILDPQMTIVKDCNPAVTTIFGFSREEMLGHTIALLHTDPFSFEEFRRRSYSSLQGNGILTNFEFQMKRKDGRIIPTEHNLVPLDDPQAGRVGWVNVVRDVTERKLLEQELQDINESLEVQVAVKTRELQVRQQIQQAMLEATDQSIIMLDRNGIVQLANETAARRMKVELKDFVGICAWDLLPPELSNSRRTVVDKVIKTGKPALIEDERDGMILESNLYPISIQDGQVERVVLFARDVTAQTKTEKALQASEEKYRLLAEASHDMIYVISEDDRIEYINSYAAAQFKLKAEKLIGKKQSSLFPEEIAIRQKAGIKLALTSGISKYAENWINFGKGKDAYISTWLIPLDNQVNGKRSVLGVSRDITAMKKMQEELKTSRDDLEKRVEQRTAELSRASAGMRLLAQKLITAQEEERRRISRELHDDTGQVLVTLKYSLAELLKELPPDHGVLQRRVAEGIKEVDEAMASVRAISHSLRPPLLDAGGLNISLNEFCKEITRKTKLKVSYAGVELENLPDDIAVTLFRFVQEAFSNILKHSQATSVNVSLTYLRGAITLAIVDNGVGIHRRRETAGIGLIGIQERVGGLGGRLKVSSPRGKGTSIRASIPWKDGTTPLGHIGE